MEPFDKNGNRINDKAYRKLCQYGMRLRTIGYSEANNKPNLFVRNQRIQHEDVNGVVSLYMDMRGTRGRKIWDDPRPLFYYFFQGDFPDWRKRRALKAEIERFEQENIEWRVSIWAGSGTEFGHPDEDTLTSPLSGRDGFCKTCGTDMQNDERYCSVECEKEALPDKFCEACETRLAREDVIRHHVSYFPEEVTTVCRSCHNKIHRDESFRPDLTPPEKESERFYG